VLLFSDFHRRDRDVEESCEREDFPPSASFFFFAHSESDGKHATNVLSKMILSNLAESAEEWCKLRLLEFLVTEVSRYIFQTLRKDQELVL
jgi:hypothetical protein